MTSTHKPIPEQKQLQILQNCKQIPKDDRLLLRKIIKQGNQELMSILADHSSKKLQVRLRKYIQKCKQNKKIQCKDVNNRLNTFIDTKGNQKQTVQSYYRSALQSLEKDIKRSVHTSKVKDFAVHYQQQQLEKQDGNRFARSSSHSELLRPGQIATGKGSSATKQMRVSVPNILSNNWTNNNYTQPTPNTNPIPIQPSLTSPTKYTLQDNYLKQCQTLYTVPQYLKYDSHRLISPSFSTSNLASLRSSFGLNSLPLYTYNEPLANQAQLTPLYQKLNLQYSSPSDLLSPSSDNQSNPQKRLYILKTILLKYYAQDIFEYIIPKYFPLTLNDKSVYLPYRQLIQQLQNYLTSKGQKLQLLKQNQLKISMIEPFTNQYQNITIKVLGSFLYKYCLHKNNVIKNIFIVLEASQGSGISIEKFRRINNWKGQELCESFQRLVKKWGDGSSINYWEVYRIRGEKQWTGFHGLYNKL